MLYLTSLANPDSVDGVRQRYPLHYSDGYVAEHDAEIVAQIRSTEFLRSSDEAQAMQLAAVQTHDTVDRLGEIAAETLVQHGEDDGIVPAENGRTLAARIPNARLTVYPVAKHIYFTELADDVNEEIAAFLAG
jgi:pimeloyl-ACP methyl ester carboxylesterase